MEKFLGVKAPGEEHKKLKNTDNGEHWGIISTSKKCKKLNKILEKIILRHRNHNFCRNIVAECLHKKYVENERKTILKQL